MTVYGQVRSWSDRFGRIAAELQGERRRQIRARTIVPGVGKGGHGVAVALDGHPVVALGPEVAAQQVRPEVRKLAQEGMRGGALEQVDQASARPVGKVDEDQMDV